MWFRFKFNTVQQCGEYQLHLFSALSLTHSELACSRDHQWDQVGPDASKGTRRNLNLLHVILSSYSMYRVLVNIYMLFQTAKGTKRHQPCHLAWL
jgi:hypothetical protein